MNAHPSVNAIRLRQSSLTVVLLTAWAFGCHNDGPPTDRGAVRPTWSDSDVVAQVGDSRISVAALQNASLTAGGGSARVTLEALINARVFGHFAETRGLEPGRRRMVWRAVLARASMDRLEAKAKIPATPTDAEVDTMTAQRWIEFDRPEALQTCHVLVHGDRVDVAAGNALAQRLAGMLRPFSRCKDFLAQAKAVPTDGAKITAEDLPPVLPDGRTLVLDREGKPVEEGPRFDPDFARGAHQIQSVGAQSSVVRSSFGWHVILLESKLPAKRLSIEERRQALTGDILRQRAKDAVERVIAEVQKNTPVVVDRAAIAAMGHVQVTP